FLVETDGLMVESAITWYTSRQACGMSPGYDRPEHQSFQREIGQGCLVCHAGRSEAIDGSLHQMRIIEEAISCERCHGPGALHVHKHSTGTSSAAAGSESLDYSIVNPAHLSRELAEAVCQQCHLRAGATVVSRGRRIDDFRPGLPLTDFRQDYTLEIANKPMTVVGHVEQMHSSLCFQKSDKFTCVTCHSPHGEPPPEQRVAHYKAVCLSCHQAEHCTVDRQKLAQESAANDCVQCHMPTSPTDIPHLAFTHHRVAIHGPEQAGKRESGTAPGVLKPFLDLSRLSEIDRKRSLGLAYIDLANHEENRNRRTHYQKLALQILTDVNTAGLKDGYVDSALASLRFDLGAGETFSLAVSSLEDENLDGIERCNSLFLAADSYYRQERYEEALITLYMLRDLRRHSVQWLLEAQCQQKLKNQPAAVAALLKATQIDPRNVQAHQYLADHFRKTGNPSRAQWHEKMAGQ
ncbi:MAG: cytochrome c3 family protein, partial [Pirellulaceae bacterium]